MPCNRNGGIWKQATKEYTTKLNIKDSRQKKDLWVIINKKIDTGKSQMKYWETIVTLANFKTDVEMLKNLFKHTLNQNCSVQWLNCLQLKKKVMTKLVKDQRWATRWLPKLKKKKKIMDKG